jgi:Polysaccharide lyase
MKALLAAAAASLAIATPASAVSPTFSTDSSGNPVATYAGTDFRAQLVRVGSWYTTSLTINGHDAMTPGEYPTPAALAAATEDAWRATQPQCNNARDDDSDGWVDFPADLNCLSPQDDDESTPPPLWTADHEEGSLADWYWPSTESIGYYGGGELNSGAGESSPTTEFAHSGNWSAKMSLSGDGGTRLFRWRESQVTRDAVYSVWIYIPAQFQVNGWHNLFQFKSRSTGGANDPIWIIEPRTSASGQLYPTLVWWHRTLEGPSPGQSGYRRIPPSAGTLLPVGRWFEVKVRLLQSADFDGRITVHIDGQQVWDYEGVRTGYRNCWANSWCTSNEWAVNNYGEALSPLPTIYVDDAEIR